MRIILTFIFIIIIFGCSKKNELEGYWVSYDSQLPFYWEITNDSILYYSIKDKMDYTSFNRLTLMNKTKDSITLKVFQGVNIDGIKIILKNDSLIVYDKKTPPDHNPIRTFVKINKNAFPY